MQTNTVLKTLRFNLIPVKDCAESNGHLIEMMQDERVQRYITGNAYSDEQVLAGLERIHRLNNTNGLGYWLIYDNSKSCVGMCLLKPMPTQEPTGNIETGYWIKPEYWGKGIAGEAATRMVQYAFDELNLKEVTGVVDARNIGSIRSLEKAGLTRRGNIMAYEQELPFFKIENPKTSR
jgi:RimJ/RimL family protein N-acetyltransferase